MSKRKILVVNSDEHYRKMFEFYFTGQGYDVACAMDGTSAIALASSEHAPDAILLGVTLPDIDGFEVFKEIRTTTSTSNIPIFCSHRKMNVLPRFTV